MLKIADISDSINIGYCNELKNVGLCTCVSYIFQHLPVYKNASKLSNINISTLKMLAQRTLKNTTNKNASPQPPPPPPKYNVIQGTYCKLWTCGGKILLFPDDVGQVWGGGGGAQIKKKMKKYPHCS